ncbi:hypothetical protein VB713_18270 [Anabaena cylindrica UHCC 0172]|uniref:hypothetical protein n=1 Tax=Anabaena cylindrica TaxID=1165 RepID=UPI002B20F137|nr:hypothetical protein [Anabaena cylindrica]MEA5552893.1 hypothetical protein [Anabaena cylindrica UHCC 0172]
MDISKYSKRPKSELVINKGRYELYNLKENPFPSSPFVNPNSNDARNNGEIYEPSIRDKESEAIEENFFKVPQSDPNHLRLGYIMDTSYIGRGNGKSAFLVNLQKKINQDFGLSISNELNKCFAIILVPASGGKTKTFESFIDLFFERIFESNIINDSLLSLRLEAIINLSDDFDPEEYFSDENDLKNKLQSHDWYRDNNIDFRQVSYKILANPYLQNLPQDFPIFSLTPLIFQSVNQEDFKQYYQNLKRGQPRLEFIFSHLVTLFLGAGFNGAYIFVDDFERVPDFQSERQKRDFALELRTCLFDGFYTNAKVGFYNLILVLHAGVPRLIQSAWEQSGLEQRSPISSKVTSTNVIRFEKINVNDAYSLIQKYLQAYRINQADTNTFSPFTQDAVAKIAELSEFNASKILKLAYEVLERAVDKNIAEINLDFVLAIDEATQLTEQRQVSGISEADTKDLMKESE